MRIGHKYKTITGATDAPAGGGAGGGAGRDRFGRDRTCYYCKRPGHTIRFCRLRRRNNQRGRGGALNNYHIGNISEGFSGVIILGQPSPGMAGGAATAAAAAAAAPTRAEEDENIEIEEVVEIEEQHQE